VFGGGGEAEVDVDASVERLGLGAVDLPAPVAVGDEGDRAVPGVDVDRHLGLPGPPAGIELDVVADRGWLALDRQDDDALEPPPLGGRPAREALGAPVIVATPQDACDGVDTFVHVCQLTGVGTRSATGKVFWWCRQ
jgi:hypothetical protein